jgi:hypothetical protein
MRYYIGTKAIGVREPRPTTIEKPRERSMRDVSQAERFWSKTIQSGDCILWIGSLNRNGYGRFRSRGSRLSLAHRWSWEQVHGPVPEGKELDHICRNRACVNVSHLEAVSHLVNVRRGLMGRPTLACQRGHVYHHTTAYFGARGHLACRICKAQRGRLLRRVRVWQQPLRQCARPACRAPFKSLRVEQRCCSKRCGRLYRNLEISGKAAIIAMRGRPLPNGSVLLKIRTSLVVCQDSSYRSLLAARMRVKQAGGDPDTQRLCGSCRRLKSFGDFSQATTCGVYRQQGWCRGCASVYNRERAGKNRAA